MIAYVLLAVAVDKSCTFYWLLLLKLNRVY
jgi:hypothetical protein